MQIPLKIIPLEIIDTYDLKALVDDQGWICMCIKKGMYGLKQAGIIANQELVKDMSPFWYHPVKHTPVLWVHNSRKTIFCLVVDDFCVQWVCILYLLSILDGGTGMWRVLFASSEDVLESV